MTHDYRHASERRLDKIFSDLVQAGVVFAQAIDIIFFFKGQMMAFLRTIARLCVLVLALGLSNHSMASNPFVLGTIDGTGCNALFRGDSVDAVVVQQQACWLKENNDSIPLGSPVVSVTGVITGCTTVLPTLRQYGSGTCTVQWTNHMSDGSTSPGSSGSTTANACPDDSTLQTLIGNNVCKMTGDVILNLPCDKCQAGNPISPLTGAKQQEQDLGIQLAGRGVAMTYDTRFHLPESQGLTNWVVSPATSFGNTWHSTLHKKLVLQAPGSIPYDPTPYSEFSSVVVDRGQRGWASLVVDNSSTCGDGAHARNTNAYISTVDAALKVVFASRSAGAASTLIDQGELSEESYSGAGDITGVAYAQGGTLSYTYSAGVVAGVSPTAGLLTAVTDHTGRSVQFTYEQPDPNRAPRINSITAPDGSVLQVLYNSNNEVTQLVWADSNTRTFRYERSDLPWALTGITDESNKIYSTYGYDESGRAISTALAGGANAYSTTYTGAPSWEVTETDNGYFLCRNHHWIAPQGTTLTQPNGSVTSLGATTANGMSFVSSSTSPAGSGSAASASQSTYDGNGNPLSRDDFNGNRACFAYDTSRNLQTVSVEGLPGAAAANPKACPADLAGYAPAPADAAHPERKVTTTWHPDWVLKAREAEPKKITTWVYNGQADPIAGTTASCVSPATTLPDGKPLAVICARYEQATTDTTGALGLSATVSGATRAWTYTYNQYGQTLTETTPKQSSTDSLSHTTTYTYYPTTSFSGSVGHTMGDLYTITNPLGQVTTYGPYDMAGRLLLSTDPNGTMTATTYWPRGWMHTQTLTPAAGASLTTTYDYWPTGLLKTVTMPDASTLNYTYDDAHRLTDVIDAAGNKVHYVLDNVGNRTSEQVSDASGNLASTVARVYDQLNRIQSTTGAMH